MSEPLIIPWWMVKIFGVVLVVSLILGGLWFYREATYPAVADGICADDTDRFGPRPAAWDYDLDPDCGPLLAP